MEPFRKAFAGDDPVRRKAFDYAFGNTIVPSAWKLAKGEPTDEAAFPKLNGV